MVPMIYADTIVYFPLSDTSFLEMVILVYTYYFS